MYFAPASLAALTRASRSRGRSVISGSTGAQMTPASTPAQIQLTNLEAQIGTRPRGSSLRAISTSTSSR